MTEKRRIAYFSMEVGISAEMPTYSGGLGVLAGDTIRAAADLSVPMVAVTLVHSKGYCRQKIDADGNQSEEPVNWVVEDFLERTPAKVKVTLEGASVTVGAWVRNIIGHGGFRIPVLLLDTDFPENGDAHRGLTYHLYGGDQRYRLCQEIILGIGGVRMLRALGYLNLDRFHLNEGHASLLACELLQERIAKNRDGKYTDDDVEAVRRHCVFTTHTPVPAGHDQFPGDLVERVLEPGDAKLLRNLGCLDGKLNMTYLALHLSHYVNGVAKRHGEVSREMFQSSQIDSITNGVHARTWAAPPFQELFDEHIPAWREDSYSLRNALMIPNHEVWEAHMRAKRMLLQHVNMVSDVGMDPDVFTIGFARRAATYKRVDLFFHDISRLLRIRESAGPFQIIFAGKAHPADGGGKDMIRRVSRSIAQVRDKVKAVYLADYDMKLCKLMVAGVDLWLNNPEPPLEASGTSGMKAALNGVPSLSVLDGWWVEGWIEGTTGWSIGQSGPESQERADYDKDSAMLYDKLEYVIIPQYYQNRDRFIRVMRHCIALNGSFFNTQRMMHQYVLKAYFA